MPSYYEIRVAGVLPPEALLDFDRLTASVEPVETVVHGPLQDQAALGGLLARFELFGVQILEVRRVHGADPPAGAADSDAIPERDVLPKGKAMDIGPVELIVLVFPGEGADPAVTEVLAEVTSGGQITVLDLAVLTRTPDGLVRTADVHENLDDIGFGSLVITAQPVITQDDLDTVRASLERHYGRRFARLERGPHRVQVILGDDRLRRYHQRAEANVIKVLMDIGGADKAVRCPGENR